MLDLLFAAPSSAYSRYDFSKRSSAEPEMDLLNMAMNMLSPNYVGSASNFPKYNVYQMLDGSPWTYFVEFALAGYDKASLDVKMDNAHLVVSSKTDSEKKEDRQYTHRGLARRDFSTKYYVGKDVEIRAARFENGLLTIELEKLVPEEQKPKSVEIV